jgi:hypothetical protein
LQRRSPQSHRSHHEESLAGWQLAMVEERAKIDALGGRMYKASQGTLPFRSGQGLQRTALPSLQFCG